MTADHGGTNNGSSGGHGGWTDAEKYIMFAATGPGVVKGQVGDMGVRDISSIVLYALGLADKQPETWTSRVPSGVFEGVEAAPRPEYTITYAFEHRTHESSPTPTGDASVTAALGEDRVIAYFPLDGDPGDALGKTETTTTGKLYYVDGYFGQAIQFDDGYISIPNYKPEMSNFSVAFWLKTSGVGSDPSIISNKNWDSGKNKGWVLSLRAGDIKFNAGDGSNRMDYENPLPIDYIDGWIYVVLVVDREAKEIRMSYDFGAFGSYAIPSTLKNASFTGLSTLNIGQDGTGKYGQPLTAELDEVLLVDGILTDEDLAALKSVYQSGN